MFDKNLSCTLVFITPKVNLENKMLIFRRMVNFTCYQLHLLQLLNQPVTMFIIYQAIFVKLN